MINSFTISEVWLDEYDVTIRLDVWLDMCANFCLVLENFLNREVVDFDVLEYY